MKLRKGSIFKCLNFRLPQIRELGRLQLLASSPLPSRNIQEIELHSFGIDGGAEPIHVQSLQNGYWKKGRGGEEGFFERKKASHCIGRTKKGGFLSRCSFFSSIRWVGISPTPKKDQKRHTQLLFILQKRALQILIACFSSFFPNFVWVVESHSCCFCEGGWRGGV